MQCWCSGVAWSWGWESGGLQDWEDMSRAKSRRWQYLIWLEWQGWSLWHGIKISSIMMKGGEFLSFEMMAVSPFWSSPASPAPSCLSLSVYSVVLCTIRERELFTAWQTPKRGSQEPAENMFIHFLLSVTQPANPYLIAHTTLFPIIVLVTWAGYLGCNLWFSYYWEGLCL